MVSSSLQNALQNVSQNGAPLKKSNKGKITVIVIFTVLIIITIGLATWYYFFMNPTTPPISLTYNYSGSDGEKYKYTVSWKEIDAWPCKYDITIIDNKGNTVASTTTEQLNWETPGLKKGQYQLSIIAQAITWFGTNDSSDMVSIMMNVTDPPSTGTDEVFLVGGQDDSGKAEYLTKSSNAFKICKEIGAELATDIQLMEAFNDGADWWSYGWYEKTLDGSGDIKAEYPCWNSSAACSYAGVTKAQLVPGVGTVNGIDIANATCYGKKPSEGSKLSINSKLINNKKVKSVTANSFSDCAGRYYQSDPPSSGNCTCTLTGC